MKTTVDIPDPLFRRLRERAAREGTTLRALLQAALTEFLAPRRRSSKKHVMNDASFRGSGLAPGVREGDWDQIRAMIYEGRGG
jgi:hypothetical protein